MGKYTTERCLALGPRVIAEVCEEVGLEVNLVDEAEGFEVLSHNLLAVGNSDAVIFGCGGDLGELSPTSNWLLGYAAGTHKTLIGWLKEEEQENIRSWKKTHPMLVECAYVVGSRKALAHAIETIRDAGRAVTEEAKKKGAPH